MNRQTRYLFQLAGIRVSRRCVATAAIVLPLCFPALLISLLFFLWTTRRDGPVLSLSPNVQYVWSQVGFIMVLCWVPWLIWALRSNALSFTSSWRKRLVVCCFAGIMIFANVVDLYLFLDIRQRPQRVVAVTPAGPYNVVVTHDGDIDSFMYLMNRSGIGVFAWLVHTWPEPLEAVWNEEDITVVLRHHEYQSAKFQELGTVNDIRILWQDTF